MNDASFAPLAWDSAFFGFPTARILPSSLDQAGLGRVLSDLAAAKIRLAYWSVDPDDAVSDRAAQACGGFPADVRMTYRVGIPVLHPSHPTGSEWTVEILGDREPTAALLALAVHAGRHSRFQADPRFPPALFQALYEEWMIRCLSGDRADEILLVGEGKAPLGLVTVQAKAGLGSIGLIAVDARYEGKGMGTALARAALAWFAGKGCAQAEVATQERNLGSRKIWEKTGFRVATRENVHHFWLGAG